VLVLINDRCSTAVLLEWAACCGESVATDARRCHITALVNVGCAHCTTCFLLSHTPRSYHNHLVLLVYGFVHIEPRQRYIAAEVPSQVTNSTTRPSGSLRKGKAGLWLGPVFIQLYWAENRISWLVLLSFALIYFVAIGQCSFFISSSCFPLLFTFYFLSFFFLKEGECWNLTS